MSTCPITRAQVRRAVWPDRLTCSRWMESLRGLQIILDVDERNRVIGIEIVR